MAITQNLKMMDEREQHAGPALQKAKRPERERKKVARFELLHSMTVGPSPYAQRSWVNYRVCRIS